MTMPHFWALYMRKVKTCKKKSALTTLAGFPSPEQLTVTGELRRQAPDNSRAGASRGSCRKKQVRRVERARFFSALSRGNTATIFAKTQQRMPIEFDVANDC